MARYMVKTSNMVFNLDHKTQLLQLAEVGTVQPSDRLRSMPDGDWMTAAEHPDLQGVWGPPVETSKVSKKPGKKQKAPKPPSLHTVMGPPPEMPPDTPPPPPQSAPELDAEVIELLDSEIAEDEPEFDISHELPEQLRRPLAGLLGAQLPPPPPTLPPEERSLSDELDELALFSLSGSNHPALEPLRKPLAIIDSGAAITRASARFRSVIDEDELAMLGLDGSPQDPVAALEPVLSQHASSALPPLPDNTDSTRTYTSAERSSLGTPAPSASAPQRDEADARVEQLTIDEWTAPSEPTGDPSSSLPESQPWSNANEQTTHEYSTQDRLLVAVSSDDASAVAEAKASPSVTPAETERERGNAKKKKKKLKRARNDELAASRSTPTHSNPADIRLDASEPEEDDVARNDERTLDVESDASGSLEPSTSIHLEDASGNATDASQLPMTAPADERKHLLFEPAKDAALPPKKSQSSLPPSPPHSPPPPPTLDDSLRALSSTADRLLLVDEEEIIRWNEVTLTNFRIWAKSPSGVFSFFLSRVQWVAVTYRSFPLLLWLASFLALGGVATALVISHHQSAMLGLVFAALLCAGYLVTMRTEVVIGAGSQSIRLTVRGGRDATSRAFAFVELVDRQIHLDEQQRNRSSDER